MTHRHRIPVRVVVLAVACGAVLLVLAAMASGAGRRVAMSPHRPEAGTAAAASKVTRTTIAVLAAAPQARTASVNAVIPFVSLSFFFHGFSELKGFELYPYYHRYNYPYAGCYSCPGHGRFTKWLWRGHTLKSNVKGTIRLTRKTEFVAVITQPGEIGRYKLIGVHLSPPSLPFPYSIRQGCVAADVPLTENYVYYGGRLPFVPCRQHVPYDAGGNLNAPSELSSTAGLNGSIAVSVSGARWFALFETTTTCRADAQAQYHTPGHYWLWHLGHRGHYNLSFQTYPSSGSGHFCVFAQIGGKFQGMPDGRVTLSGSIPFWVGDTVTITGPTTTTAGGTVTDTYSGHAATTEELWQFVSTTPCAATAEGEYGPSFGYYSQQVGPGNFSTNVTTVALKQSSYECAYLNVGAPSKGKPTGPTLATHSTVITVS